MGVKKNVKEEGRGGEMLFLSEENIEEREKSE